MGGLWSSYWYPGDDEIDPASGLTGKEKRLVKESWDVLRPEPVKVGTTIMLNLLAKHPSYRDQFKSFKHIAVENLGKDKRFQAHCRSIAMTIGATVDSLDDPGLLEASLVMLGEKHYERGQTKEHFHSLKSVLLSTFAEQLGSKWTAEHRDSWSNALEVVYSLIFKAYPS